MRRSKEQYLKPLNDRQLITRESSSAPTEIIGNIGNDNILSLLSPQSYDLDGNQIKKLQKLILRTHELHVNDTLFKETTGKDRIQLRIKNTQDIQEEKFRIKRHENIPVTLKSHYAILGDEYNLRKELSSKLNINVNVNLRDQINGRCILITAVINGQYHIVRMLINEFKAEINKPSLLGGSTPLHFATICGFRQISLFLISSGANINARDSIDCTPLHLVNNLTLVKLLLKHNADPLLRSKEGLTPLEHYIKYTDVIDYKLTIEEILRTAERTTLMDRLGSQKVLRLLNIEKKQNEFLAIKNSN